MTERTAEQADETLQRDAVERLLDWGFSQEDIAASLGHSKAWVREVQETRRIDGLRRSTNHLSPGPDQTTRE